DREVGIAAPQPVKQVKSGEVRHSDVGHHAFAGGKIDAVKRADRVGVGLDRKAGRVEPIGRSGAEVGLVVDKGDASAAHEAFSSAARPAIGKETVVRVPPPGAGA